MMTDDRVHIRAHKLLSRYLRLSGRTLEGLAAEVGVSKGHMSHVRHGRRRVSLDLAGRIKQATAGPWVVPVDSWLEH